jgi:hypothetical protein
MKTEMMEKFEGVFDELCDAFMQDDVYLMDCIEVRTGKRLGCICIPREIGGKTIVVPILKFFDDDPLKEIVPFPQYEKAKKYLEEVEPKH